MAVALLCVGVFIVAIPERLAALNTICTSQVCRGEQLPAARADVLQGTGISIRFYVAYTVTFSVD